MNLEEQASRGLIDRDDSILVVIDFQEGFLTKLDSARSARLVDWGRFLVEVAVASDVPLFVTVEDPARNGATTSVLSALFPPDTIQRDKRVFGLCGQPDLAEAVTNQPRRTAILIGMETDVCILHSAVGLRALGFRPIIVSDATAAPGDEHELGLARAAALGIERVHAKGVFYEWARSLEGLKRLSARKVIAPPLGSAL